MGKIRNNSGGELDLIQAIRRRAAGTAFDRRLALGIGDDCALLRPRPGEDLAVTTDLSIDGRHFRMGWHPPEAVGHRTLARGLSDLAAMGARPVAAFLSLGVPRELTMRTAGKPSWVERFLDGLFTLARAQETQLAGGDLAESPLAVADIVLVGAVRRGHALLRSGARPGHLLYVTGKLGAAAAGLARLAHSARLPSELDEALSRHLYPQPRVALGQVLGRRKLATAAIDLSDGLSTDLAHLCEESKVGAEVEAEAVPLAAGASLQQALHGGEDYELLFTARPDARVPRSIAGVPVTRIGRITARASRRPSVTLICAGVVSPLKARGWQHFTGA